MKRQRGEFPWDPHWENKTSTRLWCPAVSAKIRVCVGCSISRTRKAWSWSFLLRDFRKKKAIWELQKKSHFQSEAKCRTFVNWTIARWRHFTTTIRILEFVVFLCKLRLFTGKNNGFPFLDVFGYLKNTHKNPKFDKVRQVPSPNREIPNQVSRLGLISLFQIRDFCGYSLNTQKYPKMESVIFSCDCSLILSGIDKFK